MEKILTKAQTDKLFNCHTGVGFLAYNNGAGVSALEFYIDHKTKQLRYVETGKPVEYTLYEDETGC